MSLSEATFNPALTGNPAWLQLDDDRLLRLDTRRWQRPAGMTGGCWTAAAERPSTSAAGRVAWSPPRRSAGRRRWGWTVHPRFELLSRAQCAGRSGRRVRCPARRGHLDRVVLADGNIDIGGDPVRLLRRACSLLGPGGAVVLETTPSWRGLARLHDQRVPAGDWFPWAVAGRDALPALALGAGLRVAEVSAGRRRQFARLDPLP